MVKEDAPELLRQELSSPKWQPQVIFMSGVTDCYQPVERKLKLTRRCLEVLAEFRNPVFIVTKNHLVTRDIDLLSELARHHAAGVFLSITTLDTELRKVMEPRTSPPAARLAAIPRTGCGRHSRGRERRANHPRPDRSRNARNPQSRRRSGCDFGGLYRGATALRRRAAV